MEIFRTLKESQILIEQWRRYRIVLRPQSSLGYRPPARGAIFACRQQAGLRHEAARPAAEPGNDQTLTLVLAHSINPGHGCSLSRIPFDLRRCLRISGERPASIGQPDFGVRLSDGGRRGIDLFNLSD